MTYSLFKRLFKGVELKVEDLFLLESFQVAYLPGYVSERESVIISIINRLIDVFNKQIQIVALPRHMGQVLALHAACQNRIIIPKNVIDGPSLLFFSSIFIGNLEIWKFD